MTTSRPPSDFPKTATATAVPAAILPVQAEVGLVSLPKLTLARSAAPESISHDATILVLGRKGYETAVQGTNGFVCMLDRGWGAPFDWAEFWNPKIRAPVCLNPQAARSLLPITYLRTKMVLAGRSKAQIVAALMAGFASKRLPSLENGAMSYMSRNRPI